MASNLYSQIETHCINEAGGGGGNFLAIVNLKAIHVRDAEELRPTAPLSRGHTPLAKKGEV